MPSCRYTFSHVILCSQLLNFGTVSYDDLLSEVEYTLDADANPTATIVSLTSGDKFTYFLSKYDSQVSSNANMYIRV